MRNDTIRIILLKFLKNETKILDKYTLLPENNFLNVSKNNAQFKRMKIKIRKFSPLQSD